MSGGAPTAILGIYSGGGGQLRIRDLRPVKLPVAFGIFILSKKEKGSAFRSRLRPVASIGNVGRAMELNQIASRLDLLERRLSEKGQ
jgi:hypothetical protein